MKKTILTILITTIIVGGIGVYAGTQISASDITYKSGTVETALNNLYTSVRDIQTGTITFDSLLPNQTWSYKTVTFEKQFESIPEVYIIPNDGMGNGWYVRNITVNGFELGIRTMNNPGSSITMTWLAIE